MNLKQKLTLAMLLLTGFQETAWAGIIERDSSFLTLDDMPNAVVYLPPPPDTASLQYVNDWHQYIWGKSVRPTKRGQMAKEDAKFGIQYMLEIFSEPFGLNLSKDNTPEIYKYLRYSLRTIDRCTKKAKKHYMRKRPYMQFNEATSVPKDEKVLSTNGSYPSGHTNYGWATALLLAELNPARQDTLLARGYEYGQSRVITGFHYQSDVDAGRLTACAGAARLHAEEDFMKQLERARKEFNALTARKYVLPARQKGKDGTTFLAPDDYPDGAKFLPAPPDTMSMRTYGDWAQHCIGKSLRQTARGAQARRDAAWQADSIMQEYSRLAGFKYDGTRLPLLKQLIEKIGWDVSKANKGVKDMFRRKRPYVQYAEGTLVPGEEASHINSGSYPSSHAAMGWATALLLIQFDTAHQDGILKRGYEYGESRIITGYHYKSDVEAGRLMGAATLVRLFADAAFCKQLKKAKAEYADFLATHKR